LESEPRESVPFKDLEKQNLEGEYFVNKREVACLAFLRSPTARAVPEPHPPWGNHPHITTAPIYFQPIVNFAPGTVQISISSDFLSPNFSFQPLLHTPSFHYSSGLSIGSESNNARCTHSFLSSGKAVIATPLFVSTSSTSDTHSYRHPTTPLSFLSLTYTLSYLSFPLKLLPSEARADQSA